ncbi:MAG: hypothetical protein HWE30_19515 [Methylocystaceae bacterium]|nr:hypothetical protein [Methylocystaceae bacterium]
MADTIFYCWQSDTLEKNNRFLISEALRQAITNLNDQLEYDETIGEDTLPIDIDHDTRGELGSVPILDTIKKKIDKCKIFVADLTVVGKTPAGKKLMNSNVMIEYGYAVHAITTQRMMNVMNTAYGSHADLPFDMKHLSGPVTYCLSKEATKQERSKQRDALTKEFQKILQKYIDKGELGKNEQEKSVATPDADIGLFVERGGKIGTDNQEGDLFFSKEGPYTYLHIMPVDKQSELSQHDCRQAVNEAHLGPLLEISIGGKPIPNGKGILKVSHNGDAKDVKSFVQVVRKTKEVWGADTLYMGEGATGKPTLNFYDWKRQLTLSFINYLRFCREYSKVEGAVKVRVGMNGVERMILDSGEIKARTHIHSDHIFDEFTIEDLTTSELDKLLNPLFKKVIEDCG